MAFTIGFFGSLHCVGMCGPLAIAFCNREVNSKTEQLGVSLSYNLGRTASYMALGLLFGSLGSLFLMADLQKVLSIVLGAVLILSFLFSIDIERQLNAVPLIFRWYKKVSELLQKMMQKSTEYHPFQLGMANGLLPCGLVYLAIAGALASSSILDGVIFMGFFGLGTIPMLFFVTFGINFFPLKLRTSFRKVLPFVTLAFGIFLIYRGIVVDLPAELNFWNAVNNPVMCH